MQQSGGKLAILNTHGMFFMFSIIELIESIKKKISLNGCPATAHDKKSWLPRLHR
jgi:hypothetical protein